jgi:radical SAM protein with 4Fe4S-binding SPASM domain
MIQYNSFLESPFNDWQEIDIIVSRDCSLRCTYCYLQKNKDLVYDMDAVIRGVESIIDEADKNNKPGIVLSFYPEPWVNIPRTNELIKRSLEAVYKNGRFISDYMLMLGTNGVNLHKPIPILKNLKDHLSVAVTLDGIKEQHDLYRVFPDGSPSWDIVKNNMLTYRDEFNIQSTKVTLGPDTIKYLYESSLFLWDEMGIGDINMNVVFEDLWGVDVNEFLHVFEEQLTLLSDDIIANRRWEKMQYQGILGSRHIPQNLLGGEINPSAISRTYCGAASMRSVDSDGEIYPCFRLSPYATHENKKYAIKNKEISRSLRLLNNFDAVPNKCRTCELLSNCAMCVGGVIDEVDSIYWRTTHHCEFQKMQFKFAYDLYKRMNGV